MDANRGRNLAHFKYCGITVRNGSRTRAEGALEGDCRSLKDIRLTKLCLTDVHGLLTFVSLLSTLYSVSSVFPKSEFLIMPNIFASAGSPLLSPLLCFVCPPLSSVCFPATDLLSRPTAPLCGRLTPRETLMKKK